MSATMSVADAMERGETIGRAAWIVFASAFLGWMFDAMDLHLFTMIMIPALKELTGASDPMVLAQYGGQVIAVKLLAWGLGGIVFGVLADRFGRARIMLFTILMYSVCTALSGLAQNWNQLLVFQALAGLGIGGEWAAGAALVVETWPQRHRARVVQAMQAALVFGLFAASAVALGLAWAGWRWILAAGAAPAVLSLAMRWFTPESEQWSRLKQQSRLGADGPRLGSLSVIFGPQLRRRTWVATLMGLAMMVGCWGGTTLAPALVHQVFGDTSAVEATKAMGRVFIGLNVGALAGFGAIYLVVWKWPNVSRRAVFALYSVGAWLSTWAVYRFSHDPLSLHLLIAAFGCFAVGGFGILALYLTELFPTHVRATGQGFAWNAARLVTAAGPLLAGVGVAQLGVSNVGALIAAVFLLGVVAVAFGPEVQQRQA
jgi:MFS family permease